MMKIVRKRKKNTHILGKPLVAKVPIDLNGDNLFDAHLLPWLLHNKASKEDQEKFKLLCHRIFYRGVNKGRKEMKDQMLDLFERLKAKKYIQSNEENNKTA